MKRKPKKKRKEQWISQFGVAGEGTNSRYREEFDGLVLCLEAIFLSLEGRVSYRDMYEIAWQAGASAIGRIVTTRGARER